MEAEPDWPECDDADNTFTFSVEDLDLLVALVTMHHMKTHWLHWSTSCNMSICMPAETSVLRFMLSTLIQRVKDDCSSLSCSCLKL